MTRMHSPSFWRRYVELGSELLILMINQKQLLQKERDLELAARIGQTLLDQNQSQNERINELEAELSQAKDKVNMIVQSQQHQIRSAVAWQL